MTEWHRQFERVAPLHAARTSQRDVPTTLTTYVRGAARRRYLFSPGHRVALEREPSRFAAGCLVRDARGFPRAPRPTHALRTGTVRAPRSGVPVSLNKQIRAGKPVRGVSPGGIKIRGCLSSVLTAPASWGEEEPNCAPQNLRVL